jgi:hypothetical protein
MLFHDFADLDESTQYWFLLQTIYYKQERSSLYANTQLRAHRRAEKKIKSKKIK